MARYSVAALLLTGLLVGCSATAAVPTEIPLGGLRAPITLQNLTDVQRDFAGGLLQARWFVAFSSRMPDGRTVSIDSNLGPDEMTRVLQSLR